MHRTGQAAFIGQCGHECGNFRILEENLNYRAEALQKLWPKRFDAAKAQACQRNPKLIANTMAGEDALVEATEGLRDGFSVGAQINEWTNNKGVMGYAIRSVGRR